MAMKCLFIHAVERCVQANYSSHFHWSDRLRMKDISQTATTRLAKRDLLSIPGPQAVPVLMAVLIYFAIPISQELRITLIR